MLSLQGDGRPWEGPGAWEGIGAGLWPLSFSGRSISRQPPVGKISFLVACRVETSEVTGYASFCCNHTKAHLFSKLAFCYISFVCVYGITCLYTLYWLFHRPLKEYSFRSVREETGMGEPR